jgi:hypothetical protein
MKILYIYEKTQQQGGGGAIMIIYIRIFIQQTVATEMENTLPRDQEDHIDNLLIF